ncbi:MAG: molybdopterin-dependent oxidoreductase [Planctomycetota bacterium]
MAADDVATGAPKPHPVLTPAKDFYDVSRGTPRPHSLVGAAQIEARLTAESWRLEITADAYIEAPHTNTPATLAKPLTLANGNALDLPALMELGKTREVSYLKAIQCLNLEAPLGQGLWTGVPLKDVLKMCGRMDNVRRIYFWGYHNHDPKQVFKSSVSYTQLMETAPGELPVMLAYRLNGEPISLIRGGPVRMIVPWSHGYKSIKWLQHIFVTNDPRNNDTYSSGNNDPDSFLKTAAYIDKGPDKIKSGEIIYLSGIAIAGPSGLKRVEYWVRRVEGNPQPLAFDTPEFQNGPWVECAIQQQPDWSSVLPAGMKANQLIGFDKATGKALTWPMRYCTASYSAIIRDLKPGTYEIRARTVDLNDFAQPEPRPALKNGRNAVQVRRIEMT